jgi:hypothetical protein
VLDEAWDVVDFIEIYLGSCNRTLNHESVSITYVTSCSAWWDGDFFLPIEKSSGAEPMWNLVSEAAAVSMDVCRTIPAEQRTFNLSFKHYREAILLTHRNVDAACVWLREAEKNNWSVSQFRKQIRLDRADKSTTLTIKSMNHSTLYQYISSLYSFVKSCDVDEDAPILDKLEEDARSLIKVIGEKRKARTRELPIEV